MNLIGDGALISVTNEVARLKSGACYLPGQLLCSSHCVQHFSSVQHCPTLLRTYFYCQYISTPLLQYSMCLPSVKICSVFTPLTLSSNYIHFHFQCCNIELQKSNLPLNSSCQGELKVKQQSLLSAIIGQRLPTGASVAINPKYCCWALSAWHEILPQNVLW